MNSKVFVNRILNMKPIKLVGLDMDHTLIRYHTENFEALVYRMVIEQLIKVKGYPKEITRLNFEFDAAIRGLIIDSKNGNVLKLNCYGAIRQSYHGTQLISYLQQKKIYRSIYVDLKDKNYMVIDTSFSIAFCVLYSQLVDFKDLNSDKLPNYSEIALDVIGMVDEIHSNGSLKKAIADNLEKYVIKDEALVIGLKRLIQYGKKIFIITNSEYHYTKLLLNYAITPFLKRGEHWLELFEYVITLANKPRFFFDNLKFLTVNPENGTMTNLENKIIPGIFQGGCAIKFTQDLKLRGDQILYIGDHIYGDILRLKKTCNWRTALVVEELGQEIAAQSKALFLEREISQAMKIKKSLEQTYLEVSEKGSSNKLLLETTQTQITEIDQTILALLKQQQQFFNPKWGRIFRTGAEESFFAYQVERFACIYMEKLTDLLEQSPLSYFRAERRVLPHDWQ